MPKRLFPRHSLFLGLLVLLACPLVAQGSLVVSQWQLATGVQDNSGISTVQDVAGSDVVENPFQATFNTAVGPNTATAAYNFSWSGDTGSFDINTALNAETLRVRSISSGVIFISPTTNLRLVVDASLDFSSVPGDLAFIGFNFRVWDPTTFAFFFNENRRGGNLNLDPASGTLSINGDVVLPAGTTYRIDFGAESNTSTVDNPSGPVTASGFFHFAFQPIPEPATACLIALGAIAIRRKRQRRR